jgi:hypothetical protein
MKFACIMQGGMILCCQHVPNTVFRHHMLPSIQAVQCVRVHA